MFLFGKMSVNNLREATSPVLGTRRLLVLVGPGCHGEDDYMGSTASLLLGP
jgi:hypothetical protein